MLEIEHKRPECIGCGLCAEVAPQYWKMASDGLAIMHSITEKRDHFHYAEGFQEDHEILKKAVEGCPVQIIRVK